MGVLAQKSRPRLLDMRVLLASHTPHSRGREVVAYSSTGLTLMPGVLMPGAQVLEVGESFP